MTPFLKIMIAVVVSLLLLQALPTASKPRSPAARPAPRAPYTEGILGVHGRMTDEVEPWKIDRTMGMIKDMGATWVAEYFPWAYLEPERGVFDWSHSDTVIHAAASRGIRVIARLDMVPEWARPPGTSSRYLEESGYGDYARFVSTFVRRYYGGVKDIVVWNEPNLSSEWGYRPVDPASYTRMLKAAYQAVKSSNRRVSVVAAGLAPTLDAGEWALNDLAYLQGMYDAGARPYFDKLALHTYGWRSPPEDPPSPDRINFARAELIRQVMVANGDSAKKVLITESGWNDHPRWIKAVSPARRIQYSLTALDKVAAEWPWVEALCFWNFKLPRNSHNYNDYFSFVRSDFRVKPIYEAFVQRAAAGQLSPTGSAREGGGGTSVAAGSYSPAVGLGIVGATGRSPLQERGGDLPASPEEVFAP